MEEELMGLSIGDFIISKDRRYIRRIFAVIINNGQLTTYVLSSDDITVGSELYASAPRMATVWELNRKGYEPYDISRREEISAKLKKILELNKKGEQNTQTNE